MKIKCVFFLLFIAIRINAIELAGEPIKLNKDQIDALNQAACISNANGVLGEVKASAADINYIFAVAFCDSKNALDSYPGRIVYHCNSTKNKWRCDPLLVEVKRDYPAPVGSIYIHSMQLNPPESFEVIDALVKKMNPKITDKTHKNHRCSIDLIKPGSYDVFFDEKIVFRVVKQCNHGICRWKVFENGHIHS